MTEVAEKEWAILKYEHAPDAELTAFDALKQVVKSISGGASEYVVQFGTDLVQKSKSDAKQPYILVPTHHDSVYTSVLVDEVPFVSMQADNNHESVVQLLLLLIATYYVLNLDYPKKAKKGYKTLEVLGTRASSDEQK